MKVKEPESRYWNPTFLSKVNEENGDNHVRLILFTMNMCHDKDQDAVVSEIKRMIAENAIELPDVVDRVSGDDIDDDWH